VTLFPYTTLFRSLSPDTLFPLKFSLPAASLQKAAALMNAAAGETIIALHPGGSGSSPRWKAESFAELARRMALMPRFRLVITGGSGEEDLCRNVAQSGRDRAENLCGKLTLPELAAVYHRCNLLIANNTGPLHLARAMGTSVLGLYPHDPGMSPKRWGPYGLPDCALTAPGLRSLEYLEVLSVMYTALQLLESAA
jgi:ADP-heptose:LPS heptosyltransferase